MHTGTVTLKSIARRVSNATALDYRSALALVSAVVTDLRIKRVEYHTALRSWMIGSADARALEAHLVEMAEEDAR